MTTNKTQDQICFENIQSKHLIGWWRSSPYKSIGQVIHWLYVYGNLNIAERAIIGDGYVDYWGERFATFVFDDQLKIPIFTLTEKFKERYDYLLEHQDSYLRNIIKDKV